MNGTSVAIADTTTEANGNAASQAEPKPRAQIARYDMLYNQESYRYELRKTQKPVIPKKLKKKKAIIVVKRLINSKAQLESTIIEIHQEALIEVLQEIHGDIEAFGFSESDRTVDTKLLFYSQKGLKSRLQELEEANNPEDQEKIEGIQAALRFIEEDLKGTIDAFDALVDKQQITYEYLWTLFRPKTNIYAYDTATDQPYVARAKKFSYEEDRLSKIKYALIECDILEHDNLGFGRSQIHLVLSAFSGASAIQDLPVYPFKYHKDHDAFYQSAVSRGRRYAGMRLHFCQHQGPATARGLKLRINERIMVDPESSYEYSGQHGQGVYHCLDPEKLSEEDYLICTPVLLGFCFTTKAWGQFAIDRISDVQWSNEPFDRLVLGSKHKRLISALVQQHTSKSAEFDDFVAGKGKGLVGLLCGRPGCGKTLTAEAVAEVTHKPLYAVSAGELNTTPSATDEALSRILRLGERWNAVVLLDEADVYLQERDKADVARNALVSIFLRQVEYHPGILMFTTNLINHIDPAFESRIHFCVKYPDLDFASRKTVWKTFLSRADTVKSGISERDLVRLARKPLNGRQIKNVVSTAKSIASSESSPLALKHIQTVLEVMQDWQVAKSEGSLKVYFVLICTIGAVCFASIYLRQFGTSLPLLPAFLQM